MLINVRSYSKFSEHSIKREICQVQPRRPQKTVTRSARDRHETHKTS